MGDEYWEDLGRRATEASAFRYTDGMIDRDGYRVVSADTSDLYVCRHGEAAFWTRTFGILDLRDPATAGCLLTLVRELYGPDAHAEPTGDGHWEFYTDAEAWSGICVKTEGEALTAALECMKDE